MQVRNTIITDITITTTPLSTVLTSILPFDWATFLHEEICLFNCKVPSQWDAKWCQIFPLRKTWNIFKKMGSTSVYTFGRDCKIFEVDRITLYLSVHLFLIRSVLLKKLLFHAKNLLQKDSSDCDQYYLHYML